MKKIDKNQEERQALFQTMRTAFLTAYPKIFTDISNGAEIFFQATKLATEYGFSFQTSLFVANMAIEIEARHKALSTAVKKQIKGNTLVIELAAGLSPRRTEFDETPYVEIDHKPIVEIKKDVYGKMGMKEYASNLLVSDFTKQGDFAALLEGLHLQRYQKVVVVSEGLFWYLKRAHVQGMVEALNNALQGISWVWVTADCPIKAEVSEEEYRNVIANSSNRSPVEPFADFADFAFFFENNGFFVTASNLASFVKPQDVTSGRFFSVPLEDVEKRMADYTDIAVIEKR